MLDSRAVLRLHEWSIYYAADFVEGTLFQLGLMCTGLLAIYQIAFETADRQFRHASIAMVKCSGNIWQLVGTRREFLEYLIDAEALRELFQKDPL